MNMWSGVIQWLIEHKKCAVTLVLLVVLFVLINCYDNFMNGEIYIDNEILNELLEVDGNILEYNLQKQYGVSDAGVYYIENDGEFCRNDDFEEGIWKGRGGEEYDYTYYFMEVNFRRAKRDLTNSRENINYESQAKYSRVSLWETLSIKPQKPWGYCRTSFWYETPYMTIVYSGADPWGKGDKIEEQLRWILEMGRSKR